MDGILPDQDQDHTEQAPGPAGPKGPKAPKAQRAFVVGSTKVVRLDQGSQVRYGMVWNRMVWYGTGNAVFKE